MKLAVFFGVYEAEKEFARHTLGQLLDILGQHEVHVLVLDDASASRLGDSLAQSFSSKSHVHIEVLRLEKSSGFRGAMDRTLFAFRHLAKAQKQFDYVLRVDADLFFNRKDLARIFASERLPEHGMIGTFANFRWRDYLLFLADLLPMGFRRKYAGGVIEHKWELKRWKPVWWGDLGLKALIHGFRRRFIGGSFQIISGKTLAELLKRGWLDRKPLANMGLIFGEDIMSNVLVKAVGHPLVDIADLVPDWSCDMALQPGQMDSEQIQSKAYYLVHPLKGDAWALKLRRDLEALQVSRLDSV